MTKKTLAALVLVALPFSANAQARGGGRGAAPSGPPTLLVPDRVWDAVTDAPHDSHLSAVGSLLMRARMPSSASRISAADE